MMKSRCDRNSNLVHVNSSINHKKVELCCDWWRYLEFSSHRLSIRLAYGCVQIRRYRSLFLVNVYNLWLPIHRLLDLEYIKVLTGISPWMGMYYIKMSNFWIWWFIIVMEQKIDFGHKSLLTMKLFIYVHTFFFIFKWTNPTLQDQIIYSLP